ncbi:MAG: Excinuclease ABC subunit C [Parcubacteria group bacterium GW2011_GWF2_43_11]|nr:MAG: Excinuclease ABC subunit C [Parcubacteria group bacterium GW2011_GWF2_43_11]
MARLDSPASRARRVGHMFILYVLKSKMVEKSYVGVTNNIDRRLKEHNSGKHFYTKRHKPWEVIHIEEFDNFEKAREREKFLKSTNGRRFLKRLFNSKIVNHCEVV